MAHTFYVSVFRSSLVDGLLWQTPQAESDAMCSQEGSLLDSDDGVGTSAPVPLHCVTIAEVQFAPL